jgi:outer membrane lipoprotein-sorting protein
VVRRRIFSRQTTPSGAPKPLINASRADLIYRLRKEYEAIRSFSATVDMTPATGSVYKGEITEYKDIRAYILYRKPDDIRIIGLAPVVRSKVFDMVSTGQDFRVLIPPKNRFIEGRNDAPRASDKSLENLRPEAFLQAMLIPPPDAARETPLLVDATDEENALYVVVLIGKTLKGDLMINRTIFFERTTLVMVRQKEYDPDGNIISDTRYRDWHTYGNIPFPGTIDITRPKDGYGVVISIVKMDMNASITDDKFVLAQPEGTELHVVGSKPAPKEPGR